MGVVPGLVSYGLASLGGKVVCKFISRSFQRIFPAKVSALFLQSVSPPPSPKRNHPPNSHPRLPACLSRNRKWCWQTGSRQSTPLSTIRTRYGNSASTPGATRTGKNQQNSFQKGSRYGISVSTPHRRYGHRLRTPFLRTPFPRPMPYLYLFSCCRELESQLPLLVVCDYLLKSPERRIANYVTFACFIPQKI